MSNITHNPINVNISPNHQFEVIFRGSAVQGVINVRELAVSLDGIGILVEEIQNEEYKGQIVEACVTSEFRKGSFVTTIQLLAQNSFDLFQTDTAGAIANICGIAGFSAAGVLQLAKKLLGRKPTRVITLTETKTVRLEIEGSDPLEVPKEIYDLFNNPRIQQATEKIIKPLTHEGIDTLEIRHDNTPSLALDKREATSILNKPSGEEQQISETEHIFRIDSISFKKGNKWRVSDGSRTYSVEITDPDFIERVENRKEAFVSGNMVRAKLRTTQSVKKGSLKSRYEIVKVLSHINPPQKTEPPPSNTSPNTSDNSPHPPTSSI